MGHRRQTSVDWHALGLTEVERRLDTTDCGLSQTEADTRLAEYGTNRLPQTEPTAPWVIALRQFRSPLIYILVLAAVVSAAIGDVKDAGFIAGVLILNALVGAYQEWKAEQSSHALRKLLQIQATVLRDDDARTIDAEDIVPGDVLLLESGNRVPADTRLLTAHGLEIDESLLTGESLPVHKDPGWSGRADTPVADRRNMAYAGSIVSRGRAKALVVATGTATSVGQLALDVLGDSGGAPPLLLRMERFTRVIAVAVLVSATSMGLLGVLLGGYTSTEMFLFVVALAVSAIPEGLPVAMTVALAIATQRMARRGLIVRRLTAVEGLGSCTLIATDKTGTLTCNELTVREVCLPDGRTYRVTGEGFAASGTVLFDDKPLEPGSHEPLDRLARAGVLCNEADLQAHDGGWTWRGDTVDVALLSFGHKLGWNPRTTRETHRQVGAIPFEPEHQFAASLNLIDDCLTVLVKGAPERVLGMCVESSHAEFDRIALESSAAHMAERGFRILALADGTMAKRPAPDETDWVPCDLRFLGFVGMIDPLRPGAKDAIRTCTEAGVAVSMVTGDHRVTALAIARELGLAEDESQVMIGAELAEKTPQELSHLVNRIRVFARVSPRQKLQLVEAAREAGHFVAVTGDGVNDAPALRAANIGVAMGKSGTDVARDAADLVISDDNFATIVGGLEEGRVAYDNIRKVIYLSVSTGAAELVLMALAFASGTPHLPLLPVQLLWLNLVTNGIQDVALAFEPSEGDVLRRSPRAPRERIFDRLMTERTVLAAVSIGVVGFLAFRWFLPDEPSEAEVSSARNALLLLMVLFENIHIGNCRSETKPALRLSPLRSPFLLAGAAIAFSIHLAAMYAPVGRTVLEVSPISPNDWAVLFLMALTILPVMELHKWSWGRRQRERHSSA